MSSPYTPPAADATDFDVTDHEPPAADETNWDLTPGLIISAPTSEGSTSSPEPYVGPDVWILGDIHLATFLGETRTWQELELRFRVAGEDMPDVRSLDQSSGKIELLEQPDGSYTVVDRASNAPIIDVREPLARREHRTLRQSYAVNSFEETLEDQNADMYRVELGLVATQPKTGGSHGTLSKSNDAWHFELADGDISTDRVETTQSRGGTTIKGSISLSLILEKSEAIVFEESLNRQAATRTREVPDADDIAEDINDNNRNTVTVSAPSNIDPNEEIISSGSYVVRSWEVELMNDEWFRAKMKLAPV